MNGRIKYRRNIELSKQNENEWIKMVLEWLTTSLSETIGSHKCIARCVEKFEAKRKHFGDGAHCAVRILSVCWAMLSQKCAPIVSLRYVNLNLLRGLLLTMPRVHASQSYAAQDEIEYYSADFSLGRWWWSRTFPMSCSHYHSHSNVYNGSIMLGFAWTGRSSSSVLVEGTGELSEIFILFFS